MSERIGSWIQTYSGIAFYPLDPRPEEIVIEDIAHALSMTCRFSGHTREFYSVAQHSVMVSRLCDPRNALWGLLHDASEAYLNDIARPVKHAPELTFYREAEKQLQLFIAAHFGLGNVEPPDVKLADTQALGVEALELLYPLVNPDKWNWCTRDCFTPIGTKIERCWAPAESEERFLERFQELSAPPKPRAVSAAASILGRLSGAARMVRAIANHASTSHLPMFPSGGNE